MKVERLSVGVQLYYLMAKKIENNQNYFSHLPGNFR